MYLHKLTIRNFRAIKSLTLEFNKGVNVLIGENDTGKSTIIDALRICLGYGKWVREIGVKSSDFHIDKRNLSENYPEIEFHLHFKMDDPEIEGRYFLELIHQDKDDVEEQEIQLHFRYYIVKGDEKETVRYHVWGGAHEGQGIPSEVLQLIDHTFLDALRDAAQKLRPYTQNNKLVTLFENLIEFTNKEETVLLDKARKADLANGLVAWLSDENNDWKYLIDAGEERVNKHLRDSSIEDDQVDVNIDFSGYKYKDIIRTLELKVPITSGDDNDGEQPRSFSLNQNGLGQNNLIFAATILGDLLNRIEKGHYHALLIEEPEAHLHPQKQNTFFKYLNTLKDEGKDEGIQIFITSHSPTITAKTRLDFLTILQKQNDIISAVRIQDTNLSDDNKKYLEKFLDVTKSQLFFAKGVILVEGISEALLLPVFSRIMDFKLNKGKVEKNKKSYVLEKRGIEIVNVGGVAFEHFAKMFSAPENKNIEMLAAHCSIITDDDSHRSKKNGKKSDRAKKAEELTKDNVDVFLAEKTFEYELFTASEYNRDVMRNNYEKLHTDTKLKRKGTVEDQWNGLLEKLDSNRDKSQLAHGLAIHLQDNFAEAKSKFVVPDYIEKAIKWAVNGRENHTVTKAKRNR